MHASNEAFMALLYFILIMYMEHMCGLYFVPGYYLQPAVLDACLHASAIPNKAATQPHEGRIPIALESILVPQRQVGYLQAPWAESRSVGNPIGEGSVMGDMSIAEDQRQNWLHVRGLVSRSVPASTGRKRIAQTAKSKVWCFCTKLFHTYQPHAWCP
jgi:hypothetical protein